MFANLKHEITMMSGADQFYMLAFLTVFTICVVVILVGMIVETYKNSDTYRLRRIRRRYRHHRMSNYGRL